MFVPRLALCLCIMTFTTAHWGRHDLLSGIYQQNYQLKLNRVTYIGSREPQISRGRCSREVEGVENSLPGAYPCLVFLSRGTSLCFSSPFSPLAL
uniref:Putative secreted peptide n=1 Tax=Anopheles braziliensis TaxID=58242 RepID=A0A2M3ZWX9_9DIPT